MNKLIAFAIATSLVSSAASAGEVFGTVKGASGVVKGAEVGAKCGDQAYGPVKTDAKGSYRLVIAQTGKCTLTVGYKGQTETIDVASYDDAAQADLVLESKDGKLTARRK